MGTLTCLTLRDFLLIVLVVYTLGVAAGEVVRWLVRLLWVPGRIRWGPPPR